MTVRRMSALPRGFFAEIGLDAGQQTNKNGPKRAVQFSPKAKVRGSNPFGRASKTSVQPGYMGDRLYLRHG
jgi:hypothetical protein